MIKRHTHFVLLAICLIILSSFAFLSCKNNDTAEKADTSETSDSTIKEKEFALPDWAKSANIYEVNIRQYTPEGTFNAFATHLPRLKKMGVDILWLMPIFPISEEKRKGGLGSYYAVSDFREVNPEFGSMEDMESLIAAAHNLDMKIILDWVPNHTGWDHVWLKEHKEYYTQDENGNVIDPIDPGTGKSWGWTDVADLNYDNKEMRAAMIDDMLMWVKEKGTDGFRFDVAHNVPNDFWEDVKTQILNADKNQFLLAEAENAEQMNNELFHMAYGWEFHHIINDIAKGEKNIKAIDEWLAKNAREYKKGVKMHFTSNHDENSWAGTVFERMKDNHKAFAVLVSTFNGMPLIYGGQEEPLDRRLEFFEKDDIGFKDYKYADFYTKLNSLKHKNEALWNEPHGGPITKLTDHEKIYAFSREKNGNEVIVMINFSDQKQSFELDRAIYQMKELFTGLKSTIKKGTKVNMRPWEYLVYSK